MGDSGGFLDTNALNKLAFERSKYWSSLIEKFSQIDEGPELDPDTFEEILNDNEEDLNNDVLSEAEEVFVEEDNELVEDINNLTLNKKEATVLNEEQELNDFLNETIPILNEHERQLKDAGVEKILNTFDSRRIEETVGGWIRTNYKKSKYSKKLLDKCCSCTKKITHRHYDSDESFDSMDEANYIRRSREVRNSCAKKYGLIRVSPSRKILTNKCKIKSRRDGYGKKYCEEDDDHYLNYVLMRKQRAKDLKPILKSSSSSCSYGLSKKSLKIQKQRMRNFHLYGRSQGSDESSSTEDDDEEYYEKHLKRMKLKKRLLKKSKSLGSYPRCYSESSSCGNSSSSPSPYARDDNYCRKSSKVYVLDSSLSDWLVEEYPKSRKELPSCRSALTSTQPSKANYEEVTSSKAPTQKATEKLKVVKSKANPKLKAKPKTQKTQKLPNEVEIEEEIPKDSEKKDKKPSKAQKLNKKQLATLTEEEQLKLAIEESKKTYEIDKKLQERFKEVNFAQPLEKSQVNENSLFNFSKNVVNSTALANHSLAKKKQFNGKNSLEKSGSPITTTQMQFETPKKKNISRKSKKNEASDSSHVTSTSDVKAKNDKGILIYTPLKDSQDTQANKTGGFSVTKEHLSSVLGEKYAEKFFKYYIGRRIFDGNSSIYYKPPVKKCLKLDEKESCTETSQDSITQLDSDDEEHDVLEKFGKYGDLYESNSRKGPR